MVISKCVDCGTPIGGQQHKLLQGNQFTNELDGAQFPAWSEQANNMLNFEQF